MKKLEKIEELLVVVDMVNGFIREGNMKDSYIEHIIPGIEVLVREYIGEENKEVFYVREKHSKNATEFNKFPVHCLENTSESEVVDELKEYENDVRTYFKNCTCAIFAKGLLKDIKSMKNLKSVTVTGCCSDICVLNFVLGLINFFDEYNMDVKVEVREDLIETYDAPNHSRDEYNEIARKLFVQAGTKITRKENLNHGR